MLVKDKYQIKVNNLNKTVELHIEDNAKPEDMENFFSDFKNTVSKLKTDEMKLIVDSSGMQVVTQDMVPALEACFNLYKEAGFEQIKFVIESNAILKMQLNRICRNCGIRNAVVVDK